MKKRLGSILILLLLPISADGDLVVFKDGMKIEVIRAWEDGDKIKCNMGGVVVGYPKEEVDRIVKQKRAVHIEEIKVPPHEAMVPQQLQTCYDVGKNFGYCTTLSLYGQECRPQDDIALPAACRLKKETDRGIADGIDLAYQTLELSEQKKFVRQDPNAADSGFFLRPYPRSCFELGKKVGRCTALTLYGRVCEPGDEVTMPLGCRGRDETRKGVAAGVRDVYLTLGLPVK